MLNMFSGKYVFNVFSIPTVITTVFYLQHLCCVDLNLGAYLFVCLRIRNYLQSQQLFHLLVIWLKLLSSVA